MTPDAALLAEIYAHPDDDAPRLIYADLLLERGDPRGELITLQIERGTRAASQRELDLLRKHGKTWLGPLAPVLLWGQSYARTEFRRGFVARAHLLGSENRKLKAALKLCARDPAWATVEAFDRVTSVDSSLLQTAPLRALRELELDDDDSFAKLVVLPNVRHLILRGAEPAAKLRKFFPRLETVEIYPGELTRDQLPVLVAMGAKQVIAHHRSLDRDELTGARRAFKRVVDDLVGTRAELERITFDGPAAKSVVIERGRDGLWTRTAPQLRQ